MHILFGIHHAYFAVSLQTVPSHMPMSYVRVIQEKEEQEDIKRGWPTLPAFVVTFLATRVLSSDYKKTVLN